MELNRQLLRVVIGLAALSLSLAACHSSSSGSYVPPSSGVSAPQADLRVSPAHEEHGEITSSCGNHIRIKVAGILNCRFWEAGYGKATLTLQDHTNGLILISPKTGTRHTNFTITGVLVGSGYFVVQGAAGSSLKVTVKVSL
jgi:hypothetical protein